MTEPRRATPARGAGPAGAGPAGGATPRAGSREAEARAGDRRDAPGRESARPRSWKEMYLQIADQLKRQTGADVATWNDRIKEEAPLGDAAALKDWLRERGVSGYPAMLLGFETFGYPDYLQMDAQELIDGQYRDREQLRPIYDRLVEVALDLGQVELQARKTYVALIGPKRTFASIQATTRSRIDVGLRLDGVAPEGRLEVARSIGQSSMTHKLAIASLGDIDAEAVAWLRQAYEANA
jgi:Domain of unknown function (DUF5655)